MNFMPEKKWLKYSLISLGVIFILIIVIFGSAFAYKQFNNDKIYQGVYVGNYSLGGMTKKDARDFVENFNSRIAKEGLEFKYQFASDTKQLSLSTVASDDISIDLVRIDGEDIVNSAMSQGRSGSFLNNFFEPVIIRFFSPRVLYAKVTIEQKFKNILNGTILEISDKPHNANIKITSILSPVKYEVIAEKNGMIFNSNKAVADIINNLSRLSLAPIELVKEEFKPEIFVADVTSILPKIDSVIGYGDLSLSYVDPQTNELKNWNISPALYSSWIEVEKDGNGNNVFALNKEVVQTYLETLRPLIDTPAKSAKFVVQNDKVEEFQASQTGITLNTEKTYSDLNTVFKDRNYQPAELAKTVTVSTDVVNPDVQIADINNLGISDVIGIGISTFKDSHTNRIKNIANAVKRLNGTIIKPGEIFSANKYAGPYTRENGFLPEQVIKGDQIKSEIGGGMCQIGTTLFRMAMNSAMPITERRNHSLVVSYYADPVNGNPGTDATLYEPDLDFKFVNDTGNYLLLSADINYTKQQLTFTLWGKSDGRKGWYTHPIVTKWIPAGVPKITTVTDGSLKPGEKSCQGAFRGAVATFTYTRITSSSEKIDQVFDSYYRPLPQICLVGAEPVTSTTPAL